MKDNWTIIAAEREALAADVGNLTEDQWQTPSLCAGWTVHDVLGHMSATARLGVHAFFAAFVKSGFSFDKMANSRVAEETAGGPANTLARFRAVVASRVHPPGPADTWLGEVIVHSEDIRRPLGIAHQYPPEAATRVADFYKGSNLLIGAKRRISGLRLRATDTDWTTGDGPEVAGPIAAIVVAMAGRTAAIDDLDGEGVATLRARG